MPICSNLCQSVPIYSYLFQSNLLFQSFPIYSNLFQSVPISSYLIQPVQICSHLFQSIQVYAHLLQSVPICSNLFQCIPIYSNIFLYHQLQRPVFDDKFGKDRVGLLKAQQRRTSCTYDRMISCTPSTHTKYELPDIRPKSLKTAELLHHRHHIKDKIKRLAKLKRGSRREAFIAMKRRRKDDGECQNGAEISMGVSRTQNIFAINRSIASHWSLLSQVADQFKDRFKLHKCNTDPIYIDEEEAGQIRESALVAKLIRQRRQHQRPCRKIIRGPTCKLQVRTRRRWMHRAMTRNHSPFCRNYAVNEEIYGHL